MSKSGEHGVDDRLSRDLPDLQLLGNCGGYENLIPDPGQLYKPDPVWEKISAMGSGVDCETRLSDATRTRQGHEAMLLQCLKDRLGFFDTTNEDRVSAREVALRRGYRTEWREFCLLPLNDQLTEVLRIRQVLQLVTTQV